MTNERHAQLREYVILGLLVLIILGLIVGALLLVRLDAKLEAVAADLHGHRAVPCGALPTRFVLEQPGCAQKLLESMNVTNMQIQGSQGPSPPGR